MSKFFFLLWQRLSQFLDAEIFFLSSFLRQKIALYEERIHSWNLFQWWLLLLWTVAVGMFWGLFRFSFYATFLGVRLALIPFHLMIELYLRPSSKLSRVLLFFLRWLENGFGLLWLRQWAIQSYYRFLDYLAWKSDQTYTRLWNYFDDESNHPLVRLINFYEKWDRKLSRKWFLLRRWYYRVVLFEWIGHRIPAFRHRCRVWIGLRLKAFYHLLIKRPFRAPQRRFRKQKIRYHWENISTYLSYIHVQWQRFLFDCRFAFLWGFKIVRLAFRFLCEAFRSLNPYSYALVGSRRRKPDPRRPQRFRRMRRARIVFMLSVRRIITESWAIQKEKAAKAAAANKKSPPATEKAKDPAASANANASDPTKPKS